MITGNEPAFPCQSDIHGKAHKGMTLRQHIAISMLQGLVPGNALNLSEMLQKDYSEKAIRLAIILTDDLIAKLNKEPDK